MINILVVGKYNDSIQRVKNFADALKEDINIAGVASDEKSAMEDVDRLNPQVVAITMDTGDSEMILIAKKIYMYKPEIIVVVYGDKLDNDTLKQLIGSGVKSVNNYPKEAKDFLKDIQQLIDEENTRLGYVNKNHNVLLTGSTVIGFYAPKAGVGTTTCAVNTGVELAKRGRKVILVDLDLEFGDAASFLDLKPKKTIADLCIDFDTQNISISDIDKYSALHSSGLYVIAAPKSPEYAEKVELSKIKSLIDTLKIYFEYVLIDFPDGLQSAQAELFNMVNRVYLVTSMQLTAIACDKHAMSILSVLGKKDNVYIIINRKDKQDIVKYKDIHNILKCKIIYSIPSDYKTAINALNRGIPVSTGFPHSTMAKAFENLAIYIDSKNTDLDIWDMSDREVAAAYSKLSHGVVINKNKAEKKKASRRNK